MEIDYNTSDWIKKSDGYYYYCRILKTGEESTPLFKTLAAKSDADGFKIICYSETVQAYGFGSAQAAFEKIR